MTGEPDAEEVPHFFAVGIGAGPANLSLAALFERAAPQQVALFEQQPLASWHLGLLFSGVRMQTSWLKDLVSLVDPSHRLSFLNYLVSIGRIYAFLNAQHDSIPRLEYVQYLAWASDQLEHVYYNTWVERVSFDDGFLVHSGGRVVATADHLVLGLGTVPYVPAGFRGLDGDRLVVADELGEWVDRAGGDRDTSVAVVGGGQTGAECVLELLRNGFQDIRWFGRRPWFAPLDDSPSANEIYRPSYSRFFQQLSKQTRRRLVDQQVLTSDGISTGTLRTIYQSNYEMMLRTGRFPITMLPGRDVTRAEPDRGGVRLVCVATGSQETHQVDRLVAATGRRPAPLPLDPDLHRRMDLDDVGDLVVEEDFSVRWKGSGGHKIYAQNRARYTQGLIDANLSLLAMRSALIINSLFEREIFTIRDDCVSTIWG